MSTLKRMINFTICETFDCVGFDLTYGGTLGYNYEKDTLTSVDVVLFECILELTDKNVNIKCCLPTDILKQLQEELKNYFWKSMYWEEKYLEANTGY